MLLTFLNLLSKIGAVMIKKSRKGKAKERRRSFRHTVYLPIGVSIGNGKPSPSLLRDISKHGLSFAVHKPLQPGTVIDIIVPSISREFILKAKVIWCHPSEKGINKVGVAFLDQDEDFNARIVELVCRIDRYRARALGKGRKLTFEEAAADWIGKFAKILPA